MMKGKIGLNTWLDGHIFLCNNLLNLLIYIYIYMYSSGGYFVQPSGTIKAIFVNGIE